MKTLKKLSERKLDELQERLEAKRYSMPAWKAAKLLWRIMNERLRRMGL